jgi:hypothetical protein
MAHRDRFCSASEIASFPGRRVLVPNLIYPGFQFALATQPSFCVAVAQQLKWLVDRNITPHIPVWDIS